MKGPTQSQVAAQADFSEAKPGDLNHVLGELGELIVSDEPLQSYAGWLDVLATELVDGAHESNVDALEALNDQGIALLAGLRRRLSPTVPDGPAHDRSRELYGGIEAILRTINLFLDRIAAVSVLEPGTVAARFLALVAQQPDLTGTDIARCLCTDKTQVSRAATRLRQEGLVYSQNVGRSKAWHVTPKGHYALAEDLRRFQRESGGLANLPDETSMLSAAQGLEQASFGAYLKFCETQIDSDRIMDDIRHIVGRAV